MQGRIRKLGLLFVLLFCVAVWEIERWENPAYAKNAEVQQEEDTQSAEEDVQNPENTQEIEISLNDMQIWEAFTWESRVINEADMYVFTLKELPEFEFRVDEAETAGTVIYSGTSIQFPLEGKLVDTSPDNWAGIAYADVTGDGVKEFLYLSSCADGAQTWKNTGIAIYGADEIVAIDLTAMRQIECESVTESGLPDSVTVEIVESEEWYGADEEQLYAVRFEDGGRFSRCYLEAGHQAGDRQELELANIYAGTLDDGTYGVVAYYGTDSSVKVQIPYCYVQEAGCMEFAEEVRTEFAMNSYYYEAKYNEGSVVELDDREISEWLLYEEEVSEKEAISSFFSYEYVVDRLKWQELYHVTYPDSRDKSAVYLVTLAEQKGYLYLYEEGKAFQNEEGEWKYCWYVKEVAYASEQPQILQ